MCCLGLWGQTVQKERLAWHTVVEKKRNEKSGTERQRKERKGKEKKEKKRQAKKKDKKRQEKEKQGKGKDHTFWLYSMRSQVLHWLPKISGSWIQAERQVPVVGCTCKAPGCGQHTIPLKACCDL